MSRNEALEIARANHAAHTAANIATLFNGAPARDALKEFGFRHGWYRVGSFSFNVEDITGENHDHMQGGWAFL